MTRGARSRPGGEGGNPPLRIARAVSERSLEIVRNLFREYVEEVGRPELFPEMEKELDGLPGAYGPPLGVLLSAHLGRFAAGCAGVRRWSARICELKRLYVRPEYRTRGVGRQLVARAISEGRSRGYERMRLDTLGAMEAAVRLYRTLGFREIPPYTSNPVPNAHFLELRLRSTPGVVESGARSRIA